MDIKRIFVETNIIKGGLSDYKTISDIAKFHSGRDSGNFYEMMFYIIKSQIEKGIIVELEHTNSRQVAMEIAMDHLMEDPYYYEKLNKANL